MALVFMEGFEEYSGTVSAFINEVLSTMPNNGYGWIHTTATSNYLNASTAVVRTNAAGNGKSLYTFNNHYLTMRLNNPAEIIIGFAYYSTYTAGSNHICYLSGSLPSTYVSQVANGIRLTRMTDGSLAAVNNSIGATIATSPGGILPGNSWNYVEVRYKFDVAGDIQVRVNGAEVINVSGVDTRGGASSLSYYSLRGPDTNINYYDDIYVCDTTGSTNNSFLGPIGIYTLMPAADSSVQMTPSSGSNFSCVNEVPANGNTSYVLATAPSLMDLYALDNLPAALNPTSIAGVQVNARCMKPENNNSGVQLGVRSAGVSSFGPNKTVLVSSWVANFNIFETQPGGGAWDKNAVDNMDVGILST